MATRRRLGGRILTKRALTLEGIPEVAAKASKLMRECGYGNAEVAQELKRGLMIGALVIRDEAKDLVPVDTGLLRDSIFAAYGDKRKADVLVGVNTQRAVSTNQAGETVTYAGVVEFGDDYRAPHPFMRPAINAARPTVARIVKEEIEKAIDKLAGK